MRLVSWNLQWCRGMDGVVDPHRVAREVRALTDADVCCFQEVAQGFDSLPGSAGEDQVAALRAEFPHHGAHYAWGVDVGGPGGVRRRFGNLILSRLPVVRVLRHSLPWPADATRCERSRHWARRSSSCAMRYRVRRTWSPVSSAARS
jgi:endonuclease/exonuclease/phosphatase family metal-dependent hydrolase